MIGLSILFCCLSLTSAVVIPCDSTSIELSVRRTDYGDNEYLAWIIESDPSCALVIYFDRIYTEPGWDFVKIYDYSTSGLIGDYHGNVAPFTRGFPVGQKVTIIFTSDIIINSQNGYYGFSTQISSFPQLCVDISVAQPSFAWPYNGGSFEPIGTVIIGSCDTGYTGSVNATCDANPSWASGLGLSSIAGQYAIWRVSSTCQPQSCGSLWNAGITHTAAVESGELGQVIEVTCDPGYGSRGFLSAKVVSWPYGYEDFTYLENTLGSEWSWSGSIDVVSGGGSFPGTYFNDDYMVKIWGTLYIAFSGNYLFRTTSDDASDLLIDGVQVVDNGGLHGMVTRESAPIPLTSGPHLFSTRFYENEGNAGLRIEWSAPDYFGWEVIPASAFAPAQNANSCFTTTVGSSTFPCDPSNESVQTMAYNACVATYGSCDVGMCGSFVYYYASSHLQCNCAKNPGQFEWVYQNFGYTSVGDDYGGNYASVSQDSSFVRVKASWSCDSNSWNLANLDFGVPVANYNFHATCLASSSSPEWVTDSGQRCLELSCTAGLPFDDASVDLSDCLNTNMLYTDGSCTVRCASGFVDSVLPLGTVFTCPGGVLTPTFSPLNCLAEACPQINFPCSDYAQNALRGSTGDSVLVTCDSEFGSIDGRSFITTCGPAQQWDNALQCYPVNCESLTVDNSDRSNFPGIAGNVTVTCDIGFSSSNGSSVFVATCSSGTWNNVDRCTMAECTGLPISNSNIFLLDASFGSIVEGDCDSGYASSEATSLIIYCVADPNTGLVNWSSRSFAGAPLPTCSIYGDCPVLSVDNSDLTSSSGSPWQEIHVQCNTGYISSELSPSGSFWVTCRPDFSALSSSWSGVFQCVDVDECSSSPCENAICINLPGTYLCGPSIAVAGPVTFSSLNPPQIPGVDDVLVTLTFSGPDFSQLTAKEIFIINIFSDISLSPEPLALGSTTRSFRAVASVVNVDSRTTSYSFVAPNGFGSKCSVNINYELHPTVAVLVSETQRVGTLSWRSDNSSPRLSYPRPRVNSRSVCVFDARLERIQPVQYSPDETYAFVNFKNIYTNWISFTGLFGSFGSYSSVDLVDVHNDSFIIHCDHFNSTSGVEAYLTDQDITCFILDSLVADVEGKSFYIQFSIDSANTNGGSATYDIHRDLISFPLVPQVLSVDGCGGRGLNCSTQGGDPLTITGRNFSLGSVVKISPFMWTCSDATLVNDELLYCISPSGFGVEQTVSVSVPIFGNDDISSTDLVSISYAGPEIIGLRHEYVNNTSLQCVGNSDEAVSLSSALFDSTFPVDPSYRWDIYPYMEEVSYDAYGVSTTNFDAGHIIDGGSDAYDGGNMIFVNNQQIMPYSRQYVDRSINGQPFLMDFQNSYMILSTEAVGSARWEIAGNLGADGSGFLSVGSFLASSTFGYRKNVCGTSDPSINHMFITNDPIANSLQIGCQNYYSGEGSSDSDCDFITIRDSFKLFIIVYWGNPSFCLSEMVHQAVFDTYSLIMQLALISSNSAALTECPRAGGGILTITGTNFGEDDALVLVGANVCSSSGYEQENDSTTIKCRLPIGSNVFTGVLVIQKGGQVSSSEATISYTQCAPGTFQSGVLTNCLSCSTGRYSQSPGLLQCDNCPAGTYASDEGLSSCTACLPGRYLGLAGQDGPVGCYECPVGKFAAAQEASECISCSGSRFIHTTSSSTCLDCPAFALTYVNETSSENGPTSSSFTCMCTPGYYAVPWGMPSSPENETFTYLDASQAESYWAGLGWSTESGELSLDQAMLDSDGAKTLGFWCAACPNGANCSAFGTTISSVVPEEGYFFGLGDNNAVAFRCLQDPPEAFCLATGACVAGYVGPSCTQCDATDSDGNQLVPDVGFKCVICPSPGLTGFGLAVMLILFLVYLGYKVSTFRAQEKPGKLDVYLKIVLTTFQVNSIALSFAFSWDALMEKFLSIQSTVTTLGTGDVQFACLGNYTNTSSFVAETIAYAVSPLILVLLASLSTALFFLYKGCRENRQRQKQTQRNKGSDNHPESSETIMHNIVGSAIGTSTVVMFLLNPYLVQRFAMIFSCVRLGSSDDELYLIADLSVQCYSSPEHREMMILIGLPMFFLYVIGVPVFVYSTLTCGDRYDRVVHVIKSLQPAAIDQYAKYHNGHVIVSTFDEKAEIEVQHELKTSNQPVSSMVKGPGGRVHTTVDHSQYTRRENQRFQNLITNPDFRNVLFADYSMRQFQQNYAFLFLGYSIKCYYWEVVIIIRKVTLSLIAVAFAQDIRSQALFGLLLIFIAAVAHARKMPFIDNDMNWFEFGSIMSSFATFFLGVFTLPLGDSDGNSQIIASYLCACINFVYFLIIIIVGYYVFKAENNEEFKSRNRFLGLLDQWDKQNQQNKNVELTGADIEMTSLGGDTKGTVEECGQLRIFCRNLKDTDTFTVSDPVAHVFVRDSPTGTWELKGQTEQIINNLHPNFKTRVPLVFNPATEQEIKVELYDVDEDYTGHNQKSSDELESLGVAQFNFLRLVTHATNTDCQPLQEKNRVGPTGKALHVIGKNPYLPSVCTVIWESLSKDNANQTRMAVAYAATPPASTRMESKDNMKTHFDNTLKNVTEVTSVSGIAVALM